MIKIFAENPIHWDKIDFSDWKVNGQPQFVNPTTPCQKMKDIRIQSWRIKTNKQNRSSTLAAPTTAMVIQTEIVLNKDSISNKSTDMNSNHTENVSNEEIIWKRDVRSNLIVCATDDDETASTTVVIDIVSNRKVILNEICTGSIFNKEAISKSNGVDVDDEYLEQDIPADDVY